ncbi:unnamed protein product, partial [Allacma fusca]
ETTHSQELALGSKSSVETPEYPGGQKPGPVAVGPVSVAEHGQKNPEPGTGRPVSAVQPERKNPEPEVGRPVSADEPERRNPETPGGGAGSEPANETPASP